MVKLKGNRARSSARYKKDIVAGLPLELVGMVFEHLPPSQTFRLRRINRVWHEKLSSPDVVRFVLSQWNARSHQSTTSGYQAAVGSSLESRQAMYKNAFTGQFAAYTHIWTHGAPWVHHNNLETPRTALQGQFVAFGYKEVIQLVDISTGDSFELFWGTNYNILGFCLTDTLVVALGMRARSAEQAILMIQLADQTHTPRIKKIDGIGSKLDADSKIVCWAVRGSTFVWIYDFETEETRCLNDVRYWQSSFIDTAQLKLDAANKTLVACSCSATFKESPRYGDYRVTIDVEVIQLTFDGTFLRRQRHINSSIVSKAKPAVYPYHPGFLIKPTGIPQVYALDIRPCTLGNALVLVNLGERSNISIKTLLFEEHQCGPLLWKDQLFFWDENHRELAVCRHKGDCTDSRLLELWPRPNVGAEFTEVLDDPYDHGLRGMFPLAVNASSLLLESFGMPVVYHFSAFNINEVLVRGPEGVSRGLFPGEKELAALRQQGDALAREAELDSDTESSQKTDDDGDSDWQSDGED